MRGVRVALSNGENVYVDADLDEVAAALNSNGLVELGSRFVNPLQVAQLTVDQIPSIETPERLEVAA